MRVLNDVGSYAFTAGLSIGGFGSAVGSPSVVQTYNTWTFTENCAGGMNVTVYTAVSDMVIQAGVALYTDSGLTTPVSASVLSYANQYISLSAGVVQSVTPCLNATVYNTFNCISSDTSTAYITGPNSDIDVGDYVYASPDSTNPLIGTFYQSTQLKEFDTDSYGRVAAVRSCSIPT